MTKAEMVSLFLRKAWNFRKDSHAHLWDSFDSARAAKLEFNGVKTFYPNRR